MVACAAVSSQSHVLLAVPMTTGTVSVDHLRQQLLVAIENSQYDAVCEVLSDLERAPISKELLESTRVGATVNEVRKKFLDKWPDVSKRCRSLIKLWQKLVDVRPATSCTSSANATPNLISPGAAKFARRVTPCTPVNRRITSAGLSNGRSTTVSPANGSYAPKGISPSNGFHKSQSVGADLLAKGDEARNGKRKAEDGGPSLKRVKTTAGGLSTAAQQTVSAARMAVQSTTELVAQLSQNLPQHMSIDSSIRQHEEKVKREQHDEELAMQLVGVAASPYVQPERKKRKYERKIKVDPAPAIPEERRGGLVLRLPRTSAPIKEEEEEDSINAADVSRPSSSASVTTTDATSSSDGGKKIDWMSLVPSIESLMRKVEKDVPASQKDSKVDEGAVEATTVQRVSVNKRKVLALPYLDFQSTPDFLTYRYPDTAQFYAEENYRFGAEREV